MKPLRQSNFSTAQDQAQVAFLNQVEEVDARSVRITPGVGDNEPEVGSQEVVLGLGPAAGQPAQLHLLALPAVLAFLQLLGGFFAGFDLLGELHFLFGSEQVVLADRGEVLGDEVGSEAAALVRQLRVKPRAWFIGLVGPRSAAAIKF